MAAILGVFAMWGLGIAQRWPAGFQLAVCDDSDMKIAPASPSRRHTLQENSELETKEYLHHRENGNLDRAEKLATDYAGVLANLMKMHGPGSDGVIVQQKAALFAFVVRELAKEYPVPTVGAKIRQAFEDAVLQRGEALYRIVTNPEPLTLYTLCNRGGEGPRQMGEVFAKLCDREGDETYISIGVDCVLRYRRLCGDLLDSCSFIL